MIYNVLQSVAPKYDSSSVSLELGGVLTVCFAFLTVPSSSTYLFSLLCFCFVFIFRHTRDRDLDRVFAKYGRIEVTSILI